MYTGFDIIQNVLKYIVWGPSFKKIRASLTASDIPKVEYFKSENCLSANLKYQIEKCARADVVTQTVF